MLKYRILLLIGCIYHVTPVTSKSSAPSGVQILDGLCMARRTDRLLYRHRNDTHIYIAFDVLKTGTVDVFTWELLKSTKGTYITYNVTETTELALDFRKRVNRDHIVGACGKRHEKTFRHRMKRKMDHCRDIARRKKKYCKVRAVASLYTRMKIRKATFENEDGC